MKLRHLLPGVLLFPAFGLCVLLAWSREQDAIETPKTVSDNYRNLDFIFSLIEQEIQVGKAFDRFGNNNNRVELERLAKVYESQAREGDRRAQFKLGALYLEGMGVKENFGTAAHWFSMAGGRDHPLALLAEGRFALQCRDQDARDGQIRSTTIEALGKIGPAAAQAIPLIERDLKRGWPLGPASAVALGRIGGAGIPILIKALASKDLGLRRAAAEGLARAGEAARPAVPQLTQAVKDEDPRVREYAGWALKQLAAKEEHK